MVIVDFIRNVPCYSCDPLSWVSPQYLRMMFLANLVVSVVAAVFAAFLSRDLMAIPFLCSAGASYVCTHLVERYFIYEQALATHGQTIRELTETVRATECALAKSREQMAHRQERSVDLIGALNGLESTFHAEFTAISEHEKGLRDENERGATQIKELSVHVEKLTEQNAQEERTSIKLQRQLVEAELNNQLLRNEIKALRELQEVQRQLNVETLSQVSEVREVAMLTRQLGQETVAAAGRVEDIQKETAELQKTTQAQGEKLLDLQRRIQEVGKKDRGV